MPTMQEIRQQYPQYDDLPDQDLADALHNKHYSDMPKEEFYSKVGLQDQADPGFFSGVAEDFQRRKGMAQETQRIATEKGVPAAAIIPTLGEAKAFLFEDLVGEGLSAAGRGISAVTPDIIEDPIKAGVGAVGGAIADTDIFQAGLSALQSGMEAWQDFSEEHPLVAENIEGATGLATFLFPAAKGRIAAGKIPAPKVLDDVTDTLKTSAAKQKARTKKEFLSDLVLPKETQAVRKAEAGQGVVSGMMREKKVELLPSQQGVVDTLDKVKGVSKKKTLQENYNIIGEAGKAEAKRLKNKLAPIKVKASNDDLTRRLGAVADEIEADRFIRTDDGELFGQVRAVIDTYQDEVIKSDLTPAGLLQARQNADQIIRRKLGPSAFDTEGRVAAAKEAMLKYRRAVNDVIEDLAPSAEVKRSLKKQSNMFEALDTIAPKVEERGSNILSRWIDKAQKTVSLKETIAGSAILGGVGLSGALPTVGGIALAGGTLYMGGKALTGPQAKKLVASALDGIDVAIKAERDKAVLRQLRLDRSVMVNMLNNISEEDVENP